MEVIAILIVVVMVFGLQSRIFTRKVFDKLEYQCEFSTREAHEGEGIFLVETVINRKWLPVPWLKVEIHSSRWLHFADVSSTVTQDGRHVTSSFFLKGKQKVTRRWNLKCLKRGFFSIENVTLVSGDLFESKRLSIPFHVGAQLIVYPEILNLEDLFLPARYLQGDTLVRRWIVDDPFMVSGTREYTPRDSMNRIHWQATAREGKLMVRKNDFTSQLSMTILLNVQSMDYEYDQVVHPEKIELGIKVAASLLDRALRSGSPVRLMINGSTESAGCDTIVTEEASGREHVGQLLRVLALLKLRKTKDFDLFLEESCSGFHNTDIYMVTSYMNNAVSEYVKTMSLAGNQVKVILLDHDSGLGKLQGDLDLYYLSGVDDVNEKVS